jgi:glycosidase
MMSETDGHGKIREDFPGGWPTDSLNKFTSAGRTDMENRAFDYIKALSKFRKSHEAITEGSLVQYVPENGLYIFFRKKGNDLVMGAANTSDEAQSAPRSKFDQFLLGKEKFTNLDGKEIEIADQLNFDAGSIHLLVVE